MTGRRGIDRILLLAATGAFFFWTFDSLSNDNSWWERTLYAMGALCLLSWMFYELRDARRSNRRPEFYSEK